ncbi:MAG: hypothetical protein ACI4AO_07850 [Anaerotignum sp.]
MKKTTSERLKEYMNMTGLRQVDILEKCKPFCDEHDIRIGRNDLSQYVSGKVTPRQDKLSIIGMALGVSEAWLMGYDVPLERENIIPCKNDSLIQQISHEYGKNSATALSLFIQLDETDQIRITERMTVLLEDEKYSSDSVLLAARGGKIKLDKKSAAALAKSANEAPNSSQDKDMF